MAGACGGDEVTLPRVSINVVREDCQYSCPTPRYEFLLLRDRGTLDYCTLVSASKEGISGKVVMPGAPLVGDDMLYIAVRVYCPGDTTCPQCAGELEAFERLSDKTSYSVTVSDTGGQCFSPIPPMRPPDC